MLLPAATLYWYTLRSPMGSVWFSTKAPIAAKVSVKPVKGSLILGQPVANIEVDPAFPMGVLVTVRQEDGTRFSWHLQAPLDMAGDYPATVGLAGALSVTISNPKRFVPHVVKVRPAETPVTAKAVALDLGVSEYHAQRTLSAWKGYGVPKDVAARVRQRAKEMGWKAGNIGAR